MKLALSDQRLRPVCLTLLRREAWKVGSGSIQTSGIDRLTRLVRRHDLHRGLRLPLGFVTDAATVDLPSERAQLCLIASRRDLIDLLGRGSAQRWSLFAVGDAPASFGLYIYRLLYGLVSR